ncbi:hypothetical protein FBU30_003810 [Linnemannia zychae]|nr:hypothetical protein FBU30_003810 [Linnemannia zychae]
MIPLTRSRLNRYNAGDIDLSRTYQHGSSSYGGGSGSRSERPTVFESSRKRRISDDRIEDLDDLQTFKKRDSWYGYELNTLNSQDGTLASGPASASALYSISSSMSTPEPALTSVLEPQSVTTPTLTTSPTMSSKVPTTVPTVESYRPILPESVSVSVLTETTSTQLVSRASFSESSREASLVETRNSVNNMHSDKIANDGKASSCFLARMRKGRSTNGKFSETTVKEYQKYQLHWQEWCFRKKYADGDRVTGPKFLVYVKEATARSTIEDKENPHLSIRPIFNNFKKSQPIRVSLTSMKKRLNAIKYLNKEQNERFGMISDIDSEIKNEINEVMSEDKKLFEEDFQKANNTNSKVHQEGLPEEVLPDLFRHENTKSASFTTLPSLSSNTASTLSSVLDPIASVEHSASTPKIGTYGRNATQGYLTNRAFGKKVNERRDFRKISSLPFPEYRNKPNTISHKAAHLYRVYQTHWSEWCVRKRYIDGNHVTLEKLLRYATENAAPEAFEDNENPHLSIRPLCNKKASKGGVVHVSRHTMKQYVTAVRALYKEQCARYGLTPSIEILSGQELSDIIRKYDKLIGKSNQQKRYYSKANIQDSDDEFNDNMTNESSDNNNEDLDDNDSYRENEQDSIDHNDQGNEMNKDSTCESSLDSFRKLMRSQWALTFKNLSLLSWRTANLYRLRSAFEFYTASKHDLSNILLTHVHQVHVWSGIMDTLYTTGIGFTKMPENIDEDDEHYTIFLREEDVQICPVGSLAFYLLSLWNDEKSYPNFRAKNWKSSSIASIDGSSKPLDNLSPLEYEPSSSSPAGIDTPFNSSQLHRLKPLNLSTSEQLRSNMLTVTYSNEAAFQLPRNRVLPPAELQKQLFPFIENLYPDNVDWQTWIDNIMMDKPLDTNEKESSFIKSVDIHVIRIMRALACLRKVILQDFAVMMSYISNNGQFYLRDYNHTLHPVFATRQFEAFALQLHKAMSPVALPSTLSPRDEHISDDSVHDLQVHEDVQKATVYSLRVDINEDSAVVIIAPQQCNTARSPTARSGSSTQKSVQENENEEGTSDISLEATGNDITPTTLSQNMTTLSINSLQDEALELCSNNHVSLATSAQYISRNNTDTNAVSQDTTRETEPSILEHENAARLNDDCSIQHRDQINDVPSTYTVSPSVDNDPQQLHVHLSPETSEPHSGSTSRHAEDARNQYQLIQEGASSFDPPIVEFSQVSINSKEHANTTEIEQLRQIVKSLANRVAFLEKEKNNKSMEINQIPQSQNRTLSTPEPPSTTSTLFSVNNEGAITAILQQGNEPTDSSKDEINQNRCENQDLWDKLAYLENENRTLSEQNIQFQIQDLMKVNTGQTVPADDYSHCEPANRTTSTGNSNNDENQDSHNIMTSLEQEIQDLRTQITTKLQERNKALNYTMASIESVEFLDSKMVQMEQSIHGLWAMLANNEVPRCSTASMGGVQGYGRQQHYQQPHDRHHHLRLRVDTMRRRIGPRR